jgi:hypothetical protein
MSIADRPWFVPVASGFSRFSVSLASNSPPVVLSADRANKSTTQNGEVVLVGLGHIVGNGSFVHNFFLSTNSSFTHTILWSLLTADGTCKPRMPCNVPFDTCSFPRNSSELRTTGRQPPAG